MKGNTFVIVLIAGILIGSIPFALRNFSEKSDTVPAPPTPLESTLTAGQSGYIDQAGTPELSRSVCDPQNGNFSLTIDNPYMPLPLGMVHVMEEDTSKVQISVLPETETVAGVTTRVVEEREWEDGVITEISRNFFVQSGDGSVCYYGEDVDEYTAGKVTSHGGAWRAGVGQNKPGIAMPANVTVGQRYKMEEAPGIAEDLAQHVAIEKTYTTPAGTFYNVLFVKETPSSDKRYAPGIGMIYDDGAKLTQY